MFVCYIVARLNNSDWINVDDKVLFKMANITLSCKERQLVLFQMIKKGYLGQAKKEYKQFFENRRGRWRRGSTS